MKKQIKRRRKRARRHLRHRGVRVEPGTITGLVVLLLLIGIGVLLGRRGGEEEVRQLVAYARERPVDPVEMVVTAARTHRIVFLGDVYPAAAPKWIAAESLERAARGPGLDAVVLEVPTDLQPQIDAYLDSDPEDVSHLLRHSELLQERWGVFHDYLEIYRRVWRLNHEFGPGRRIRIVAADLPEWPPGRTATLATAATLFARRDAHMAEVIDREVLAGNPRSRVLIFMGGYHGLKSGSAALSYGGGDRLTVTWLATRLQQRYAGQIYSIVVDGARRPPAYGIVASYATTRVFELLRRHLPGQARPFALVVNDRLDFVRDPIHGTQGPGLSLSIEPAGYRLQAVVDGYIYLGTGSGMGLRR